MDLKSSLKTIFVIAFVACVCSQAQAGGDWRVGLSLGLGGAGIDTGASLTDSDGNSSLIQVSRNEGPGIASIFVDRLLSDRYTFGIEHIRGFRFGPASSGVSFTGVMGRWYWSGFAPSAISNDSGSVLLVKRFTPFAGLMAGIARGTIDRSSDQVPQVDGSGVYFGMKLGADYPIAEGIYIRPEISTASTILSQGAVPTTLKEFGLQCGLMFAF